MPTELKLLSQVYIRMMRTRLRNRAAALDKQYEDDMKDIKDELAALQKRCPHPPEHRFYEADPSGNHDSSSGCDLCGKGKAAGGLGYY